MKQVFNNPLPDSYNELKRIRRLYKGFKSIYLLLKVFRLFKITRVPEQNALEIINDNSVLTE